MNVTTGLSNSAAHTNILNQVEEQRCIRIVVDGCVSAVVGLVITASHSREPTIDIAGYCVEVEEVAFVTLRAWNQNANRTTKFELHAGMLNVCCQQEKWRMYAGTAAIEQ